MENCQKAGSDEKIAECLKQKCRATKTRCVFDEIFRQPQAFTFESLCLSTQDDFKKEDVAVNNLLECFNFENK